MNEIVVDAYHHFSDYFELTKPRITLLVLFTTLMGMYVSSNAVLPLDLVFYTLLGTGLASSASGLFNNYFDRDIDPRMARTRTRALASGKVDAINVLVLAALLAVLAVSILFVAVNPLTASLVLFTIGFYVIVYTLWLKRRTAWCTEIGGVAGAMPPLIGAAAVSNSLTIQALLLFLLMFLWQPPHFWALALLRVDEYRSVGVPMLPVTSGVDATKRRMKLYTVALLPISIAICWVFSAPIVIYLTILLLNGIYLYKTWVFGESDVSRKSAMDLFSFSIIYLFAMFGALFFMI